MMIQQHLFDVGLSVCSLFVGNPIELNSLGDRSRAAQLALLTVLLTSRSGKPTTDDIVRDSSKAYPDGGKWLGRAIAQLAEDGLIRCCGTRRSRRPARNAGLLHEWELADRKAANDKVRRIKLGLIFHKTTGSADATTEPAKSKTNTTGKGKTNGQAI